MELSIHLLASQVYFLEECFFTAFTAPEFLISKANVPGGQNSGQGLAQGGNLVKMY